MKLAQVQQDQSVGTPGAIHRSRALSWAGFYGLILAAWASIFVMTPAATESEFVTLYGQDFWNSLCRAAADAEPLALMGMWMLMSIAMMAPTLVPTLKVYDDLGYCDAADTRGFLGLVSGYLGIWFTFSVAAAAAQMALAKYDLLAPDGSSRSVWLTVILLGLAGLYQFSALKEACLTRCRQPLAFFLEHWRPGTRAAFSMGARLGANCLGCCWALMALGFIGGTMNLVWMGAATAFMILEKLPDIGRHLSLPLGGGLLMAAGAAFAHALGLV